MNQKHISSSVAIDRISAHFSAAHILVSDHYEEGLHGHNYLVGIEVEGSMDIHDMIVDFVFLENMLSEVLTEWDHFVLLPSKNKNMKIHENKDNLEIVYGKRLYSIPKAEIKLLDCTNVTAETLARLLGEKIQIYLKKETFWERIQALKVTIWEKSYYRADYTIRTNSLES
ncbi:MAG: 6-carboxytetrahydropterin synthase [Candidatus Heimdallarchaeota archaeon]|nr:MAG: 6-carboxytetrahydropterin synthase [Candidatus Heimdallarchaeota archaeon]